MSRSNLTRIDAYRELEEVSGKSDSGPGVVLNVKDYWLLVKRHKWSIIVFALIGILIGWFVASSETPLYRASATLIVEPEKSNLASIDSATVAYNSWRYFETQYRVLTSRALAERVVDELDLQNRPVQPTTHPRLELPLVKRSRELASTVRQWVMERVDAIFPGEDTGRDRPASPGTQVMPAREGVISRVQANLGVSGGDRSQVVSVSFVSPDPVYARDVANAAVEAFIAMGREARLEKTEQAGSWLAKQIQTVQRRLRESEIRLQEFQAAEGVVNLNRLENLKSERLGTLNSEFLAAQNQFAELSERYGPKHPKIIQARADLAEARQRLERESSRAVSSRDVEFELAQLEKEVSANQELYDLFVSRFNETDLSNDTELTNGQVLDRALVPAAPFSPDINRIISMWGMIGLLVGIFIAFMREHLDNTFKTHEQLEKVLRLPVLGILPFVGGEGSKKGRRSRHPSPDDTIPERHFVNETRSVFSESVNQIRTGILFSNVDKPPNIILVTSAVQSEGKTTLSTNLALSFGQLGRTLLIDADLRKPRVASASGLEKSSGLVEYVAGLKPLQECVVQDRECSDLYILRSGAPPPNPLELLSSKKMTAALEQFKNQFAHIVIDTAPLLPVSDAIVLGHLSDAIVMVVQANETTHSLAHEAVKRMRSARLEPLGTVLSQLRYNKAHYYYRDKYYYSTYYGGKSYTSARSA